MIKINNTIVKIMKHLEEYGVLSKKNKPSELSGLTFYLAVWYLRDKQIIKCNGFDERSKIWTLTEKGKRFLNIIKQLEAM